MAHHALRSARELISQGRINDEKVIEALKELVAAVDEQAREIEALKQRLYRVETAIP